jgi:hypothetical protein
MATFSYETLKTSFVKSTLIYALYILGMYMQGKWVQLAHLFRYKIHEVILVQTLLILALYVSNI